MTLFYYLTLTWFLNQVAGPEGTHADFPGETLPDI